MNMVYTPKVYVIVLNYNGYKDTIECLESLLELDYANFQIIVVDNASKDNSIKKLTDWANSQRVLFFSTNAMEISKKNSFEQNFSTNTKLIFIESNENNGYAAGNNIGINFAIDKDDFDYIWILNNDTVVDKYALKPLVFSANQNSKVGIWASKLLYYYSPNIIQNVGCTYNKWLCTSKQIGHLEEDKGQYDDDDRTTRKIDFVVGASSFLRKSFIHSVGLMCEEYFLYCEELDWALRGKAHGFGLGYVYESKVFHKEGGSIGSSTSDKKSRSKLSDYYGIRSKLILTQKFFPNYLPIAYLGILTIVVFSKIRYGQLDRIKMIMLLLKDFTGKLLRK